MPKVREGSFWVGVESDIKSTNKETNKKSGLS